MTNPRALGPRWTEGAVAIVLLLIVLLLFFGAVFRGEVFFERDLHLDWYPRIESFVQSLGHGSWPVWDNSLGFGQPLLADPSAQVLYPPTWMNLLVLPWTYYTLYVVAHLVFSGLGLYRLGRALDISPPGALGASAAWVLSGPLLSLISVWHHFAGAAWIPWVLLAAQGLFTSPELSRALVLGLTLAAQILAGSADVCAMTLLVTAASGLAHLDRGSPFGAGNRRLLTLTALAVTLALALSAALWLPALDVARRSSRWGLPADVQTAWSIPPAGLVRILFPLLLDDLPLGPGWRLALFDREHPFLNSIYLGLPTLGLVALSLAARGRRDRGWIAAVAAAALLASLGQHTPLYSLALALLPPLGILRYPSKALIMVAFACALLAGMGLDVLRQAPLLTRRRFWLAMAPLALLSLLGGTAAGLLLSAPHRWGLVLLGLVPEGPGFDLVFSLGRSLAVSALGTAALVLMVRQRLSAGPVAGPAISLAILLMAGDLFLAHRSLNPTAPRELLTVMPPAALAVKNSDRARLYVYDYHMSPGKSRRYLGRDNPYPIGTLPPDWVPARAGAMALRLYLFPPLSGWWGIEGSFDVDSRGLYSTPLSELTLFLRAAEGTPIHLRMLRMGTVRWVIALHEKGLEDLVPAGILTSMFPEPIRLFRVPDPLPRTYAVGQARVAEGGRAFAQLADPTFDPTREVILAEGSPLPSNPSFGGASRILDFRPDRVRLEADLKESGYVVLVDSYDPGWRAEVDGVPARLLRANVAFRAVPVPAGHHFVDMVYRPPALTVGLGISGAALLAITAWGAARKRAREGSWRPGP